MRILLVDDDDVQLRFLESLFVEQHHVHSCSHGDEALVAYKRFAPWDWVITDYIFLPGDTIKNGLYLVNELRRLNPQQQIVVQTSEEYLPLPHGVKFLHKPFPAWRLLHMLRQSVQTLLPLSGGQQV